MANLSIFESLSYATARIECSIPGGFISTGTGFFSRFVDENNQFVPAIITNKHVIENATEGSIHLTLSDGNGNPIPGATHRFVITDFQKPWKYHSNPDVDLCAMPINNMIQLLNKQGKKPFVTFVDRKTIPNEEEVDDFAGMENVVMVGYPDGLWDSHHNQPLFRSGVMSTHYRFDWNGKPEFVIDAACVSGSSGSPVFIIDIGRVYTRSGVKIGPNRVHFLGVLYAGPVQTADGEIVIRTDPLNKNIGARTDIPINLGYVIKASQIEDFEKQFRADLGK